MAMTLITTNTAADASESAFTSSIDSTYKLYIFEMINISDGTNGAEFQFNVSTDGGTNYNLSKTSTMWQTYRPEDDSTPEIQYRTPNDLANGTGDAIIAQDLGGESGGAYTDSSMSGTLWLFNPSNTTYVKHWYSITSRNAPAYHAVGYTHGYVNAASSDIDAIIFRPSTGTFDGKISMYGVG